MNSSTRLDEIGWALFLVMIGVLWLVPDTVVPQGAWLVGAGVILLALNLVRSAKHMQVNGFTTALGAFAFVAGIASVAGIHVPLFPIALVVIGAMLLLKPLFVTEA